MDPGSADQYLCITDLNPAPDPVLFFSGLQDAQRKIVFSAFFCYDLRYCSCKYLVIKVSGVTKTVEIRVFLSFSECCGSGSRCFWAYPDPCSTRNGYR
jgi:hypothetical protein